MICKYYVAGNCSKQGSRCMFAHGPEDLRTPGTPLPPEAKEMVSRVLQAKMASGADKTPARDPQVVMPTPQQRALLEAAQQLQAFAATAATSDVPAVGQLAAIASAQSVALGQHAPQAAQLMAMAGLAQQLGGAMGVSGMQVPPGVPPIPGVPPGLPSLPGGPRGNAAGISAMQSLLTGLQKGSGKAIDEALSKAVMLQPGLAALAGPAQGGRAGALPPGLVDDRG